MDFLSATEGIYSCNRRGFVSATCALTGSMGLGIAASSCAGDRVSGVTRVNRARLLSHDATALQHRLQLIDMAQCEILLSAYEVGDDPTALRIMAGLRAAARRGVNVKLLVDGHSNNNLIPKPMMQHLIAECVSIKEHMPDARYELELGRERMHDKLLVVDGEHLIIGGRNMRADYYGLSCPSEDKIRWDREAYVSGPIAASVRGYFGERWRAGTSGPPTLDRDEKQKTNDAQELAFLNDMPRERAVRRACQLLDSAWSAALPCHHQACHQTCQNHHLDCDCERFMDLACVRFLHDIPEHAKDCPAGIAQQLNCAVSEAQHSLLISTPYLVVSNDLCDILKTICERGVDVCLLTNSLTTTDRTITHAQYANERKWMMRSGIQLWEMKGQRMLHSKAMVIDGMRSMIGSYNFDILSETRNSETALLIDDVPFAEALTAQVAQDLLRALPVEEPLLGFDARTNDVDARTLRRLRSQRAISPWIKRYL